MDALANTPRRSRAMPRRLLRLRSDLTLAARFVEGDETAFAVLYERHRKSVLAICMGVLGSRHDAEDAAQDAFAALAVSLRKGLPDNVPAWLSRVARNAAIDVARRRRGVACPEDAIPRQTAGDGVKAELDSVMAGIKELPETQRTALLMRELAGHSYREIATLLEVDEAAVSGLIARARISLRSHREAAEISCANARLAVAADPDARHLERAVRWHVRRCASCRAYQRALRADARALHSLIPDPPLPLAGGGAVFGSLAAKAAVLGATASQVTAACAVSICAVGGVVLLAPHAHPLWSIYSRAPGVPARAAHRLPSRSSSHAKPIALTAPQAVTAAGPARRDSPARARGGGAPAVAGGAPAPAGGAPAPGAATRGFAPTAPAWFTWNGRHGGHDAGRWSAGAASAPAWNAPHQWNRSPSVAAANGRGHDARPGDRAWPASGHSPDRSSRGTDAWAGPAPAPAHPEPAPGADSPPGPAQPLPPINLRLGIPRLTSHEGHGRPAASIP